MERTLTRSGRGTSAKPRNGGWPSRGGGSADFRHLDLASCHATPGRVDGRVTVTNQAAHPRHPAGSAPAGVPPQARPPGPNLADDEREPDPL